MGILNIKINWWQTKQVMWLPTQWLKDKYMKWNCKSQAYSLQEQHSAWAPEMNMEEAFSGWANWRQVTFNKWFFV